MPEGKAFSSRKIKTRVSALEIVYVALFLNREKSDASISTFSLQGRPRRLVTSASISSHFWVVPVVVYARNKQSIPIVK